MFRLKKRISLLCVIVLIVFVVLGIQNARCETSDKALEQRTENIESRLSIGYCQPYLAQYGLEKGTIERFYQDAGRYQSYSRKHKRIKNVLKVKVFCYAILTHLNPREH